MSPLLGRSRSDSLGLFIKATLRDLQPFLFLQDDLRRFSRIGGPIVVSVPEEHVSAFRDHMLPGYRLVSDGAVARAANIFWPIRDNWYTQQLIKLCAIDVITTDVCLVLDGNTIINSEFDESTFQLNGRWVYELGEINGHDLELERRSSAFLRNDFTQTFGFRPVNQVFVRSELTGLRRYLESIYRVPWCETLYASCECAIRLKSALWTEFQMYGTYTAKVSSSQTHEFVTKNSMMYFNPTRHLGRLSEVLSSYADHRPFMIKAYRQRPEVRLSVREYGAVAAAIRTACRGGGVSSLFIRRRSRRY
jgi:Family of unknown function (DUF6492)